MTVQQREFRIRLASQQERFARLWWPLSGPVRAVMAIVPGLGEHSGRYAALAMRLAATGAGVVAMDLQGQGLSPGWRGCIDSYSSLLAEVAALVHLARGGSALEELAHQENSAARHVVALDAWPSDASVPVCLYGHSMGGNLVLNAVLRRVVAPDRLIASAPMLRAVHPPSPAIVRLARLLMRVAPHYRLKAPVRKEYLSHLPAEREAYASDPLIHRRVSLRLGAGLIDSGLWALEHAGELDRPCLLLHGSEDRITDPAASREFALAAVGAGAACHLISYPGMLHDLHRDEGRDQVITDIANWL